MQIICLTVLPSASSSFDGRTIAVYRLYSTTWQWRLHSRSSAYLHSAVQWTSAGWLRYKHAEVELAALNGGFLDLTEAGLHSRVTGGDDVERADSQHQNDDHCEQRKKLLHNRIPLYNNVSRAEALQCVSVT